MVLGTSNRDTGYAVNLDVMYGSNPFLFEHYYGGIYSGSLDDKAYFLENLKSVVESAITDFVEVNFLSDVN